MRFLLFYIIFIGMDLQAEVTGIYRQSIRLKWWIKKNISLSNICSRRKASKNQNTGSNKCN